MRPGARVRTAAGEGRLGQYSWNVPEFFEVYYDSGACSWVHRDEIQLLAEAV
jgi:hypothetical protein